MAMPRNKEKETFEAKYGANPDPAFSGSVLIGMKGGKAIYGDPNAPMEGAINRTATQNMRESAELQRKLAQTGGVYSPTASSIRQIRSQFPLREGADTSTTFRPDGQKMIGVESPEAQAMRQAETKAVFDRTLQAVRTGGRRTRSTAPAATAPAATTPTATAPAATAPAATQPTTPAPMQSAYGRAFDPNPLADILFDRRRRMAMNVPFMP